MTAFFKYHPKGGMGVVATPEIEGISIPYVKNIVLDFQDGIKDGVYYIKQLPYNEEVAAHRLNFGVTPKYNEDLLLLPVLQYPAEIQISGSSDTLYEILFALKQIALRNMVADARMYAATME